MNTALVKIKVRYQETDRMGMVYHSTEFKNSTMAFNYNIGKGRTLIASGKTKHAFTNVKGKVVRIPLFLVEALHKERTKNG